MELTAALRILRARRWLLAVGLAVAIAAGLLVTYRVSLGLPPSLHSRQQVVGESTAQVLIDTPVSQIAAAKTPPDQTSLFTRASELGDLMASAPVHQTIARTTGIGVGQLTITPPVGSVVAPLVATPLASQNAKMGSAPATWNLGVTVDPALPIIAFDANAPSPAGALRLATAAVGALNQLVDKTAASQGIPSDQRLVVRVVGPPLAAARLTGPTKAIGAAVTLVVFLAFCLVVILIDGSRRRRALSREPAVRPADAASTLDSAQADQPARQHDRITALRG